MKRNPEALVSIYAGLATAGTLLAVMLFAGCGAHALANGWYRLLRGSGLLSYQLLPDLAVIAYISGFAVLSQKNLHPRRVILPYAIALGLLLMQGCIMRSEVTKFQRIMPAIQTQVTQNLAARPSDEEWMPTFSRPFWPRLSGALCGSWPGGSNITVSISDAGKLEHAHLEILDVVPADADKPLVTNRLRQLGVREYMLVNIRNELGFWVSEHGRYSLTFVDY